jgi:hypothetical protein
MTWRLLSPSLGVRVLLGGAVVALAACGGAGGASSSTTTAGLATAPSAPSSQASSATTTHTHPASPTPGSEVLPYIGSFTDSGKGTIFREEYRLGAIKYGSEGAPPSEVLEACNRNDSTVIETSGFARGQVTLAYLHGVVPATAFVTMVRGMDTVAGPETFTAIPVLNHDGSWDCAGNSQERAGSVQLTFRPGQSTTYELWFLLLNARTNVHPTLPQHTINEVTLSLSTTVDQIGLSGTSTVQGPHAATCMGPNEPLPDHLLLPYGHLPFAAHGPVVTLTCRRGGGTS